jgi:hypothetical protein
MIRSLHFSGPSQTTASPRISRPQSRTELRLKTQSPDTVTFRGKSPEPELSPLIETVPGSPVSGEFKAEADQGIKSLPDFVQKALEQAGWRIRLGQFLSHILEDTGEEPPRGFDSWASWDNTPACSMPTESLIAVSEHYWSPAQKPSILDSYNEAMTTIQEKEKEGHSEYVPTSRYIDPPVRKGDNELVQLLKPSVPIKHEIGHAVDAYLGELSKTQAFWEAYCEDFYKLTKQQKAELYYYIQPDEIGMPTDGGLEEACAEAFSSLYSGDDSAEYFQRHFPSTVDFVKQIIDGWELATLIDQETVA